jgi:hypothetical protein
LTFSSPERPADLAELVLLDPLIDLARNGDAVSTVPAWLRGRWPAIALVGSLVLNGFLHRASF